jgi:acyl-CoA synthetase (NDP forming)
VPAHVNVRAREALERARRERRPLLEPEAYELVRALGVAVPAYRFIRRADDLRSPDLEGLPGEQVVLKVVATGLPHKTDVGGVEVVPKELAALRKATARMERALGVEHALDGFLLCELVDHDRSLEGELLLGLRWSDEFGPLVTLGPGGTDSEFLADQLERGRAATFFSPALRGRAANSLDRKRFLSSVCAARRGRPPRFDRAALEDVLARALELAESAIPHQLGELEINPLVSTAGGLIALDALARPGSGERAAAETRPTDQIRYLLEPRSVAVVGVSSTRMNPGRLIVRRLHAAGYDGRLTIVKPGTESVDGCPCVPDLEALDTPVDLLVLSLSAPQAVAWIEQSVAAAAARSVILIPGGLEERVGGEVLATRVRAVLERARAAGEPAPVVNGGNCLGVRSRPGRVDTLFLPQDRLPLDPGNGEPLALVSQSGAFAIAREGGLGRLTPRYLISVGNQTDLTVGDYLSYLAGDADLEIFACYVEGFRPLDGRRFLEAAARIHKSGRAVVLYRGGRTTSGVSAAASHTAAIGGSYRVTRELAEAAGILVAETLDDFTDLVRLLCLLRGRGAHGRGLGALSNAGFECVTLADGAGATGLELAPLSDATRGRLRSLLIERGLGEIVTVRNPIDVTPMLDDEAFASATRLLLADDTVDVAVIGCVPHTGALDTLAPGSRPGSVAHRLADLFVETGKPWVTVVDGGPRYDPMVEVLEAKGVPVFRSADRALRALGALAVWRLQASSPGRTTRAPRQQS